MVGGVINFTRETKERKRLPVEQGDKNILAFSHLRQRKDSQIDRNMLAKTGPHADKIRHQQIVESPPKVSGEGKKRGNFKKLWPRTLSQKKKKRSNQAS